MSTARFNTWKAPDDSRAVDISDIITMSEVDDVVAAAVKGVPTMVSVKDYDAVGDGVTDDTSAIQAAITYLNANGGGRLYFPKGEYKITSTLNLSASIVLEGEGRYTTLLHCTTLNTKIVNVTGDFCGLQELSLRYNGTPVSGAVAVFVSGRYMKMRDFVIRNAYIGVHFSGANAVGGVMGDFQILDYESVGILAQSMNDLFISKFILNAGNTTRGALGGIRLYNKAEAVVVTDGDILLGVYSMTTAADSYAQDLRPAYNNFTNVFFDSAANSTVISQCVNTEFVGCWFSSGRSGGGNAGADLSTCSNIRFTSCRFFNCGSAGVFVQATALRVSFVNCSADNNSVTSGAGNAHGFQFQTAATGFQLVGCTASNAIYTGVQGYGAFLGTGCTNAAISNCNFQGNSLGAVGGDLSGTGLTVSNVLGLKTYNKGTAAIAVGQTVATVTHGLGYQPSVQDIRVVGASSPVSSGVSSWYVTAVGATTFQIAVNATVTSTSMNFGWQAEVLKS